MNRHTVVLKLGGELLAEAATLTGIAAAVARAREAGHRLAVVHGGGPQATDLQRRLGLEPKLVAGRRITDALTLDVVTMTFAGKLNTELVAALTRAGLRAVGLTGVDAGMLRVRRRPPVAASVDGGPPELVDYGFVGDVEGADPALPLYLMGHGFVPVICSLAANGDSLLNVNADTVAAELAVALGAERLVVLAAVPGVYRNFTERRDLLMSVSAAEARRLVGDGVVGGGMAPKLTNCASAVERGVRCAAIVDGRDAGAVVQSLIGHAVRGTTVHRPSAAATLSRAS